MKKRWAVLLLICCFVLTGCASLLDRQYSTAEPHSSKFWESEAAGTLRAENYQDVVNDLLLLIGEHTEAATLRLYNVSDDFFVAHMLERAAVEIQQETPMGAYAVEYITTTSQAQRGYYEVQIQIGYRRTAEQIRGVINATAPEALYTLLDNTLKEGKTELAVRIGYWGQDGQSRVEEAVASVRAEYGLEEAPGWTVNYYPPEGPVGMVEVLLDVPPEEPAKETEPLPENGEPEGEAEAESEEESETAEQQSEETAEEAEEKTEKLSSEA